MDPNQTWSKILSEIKQQLSLVNYRTWFANLKLESFENGVLTLKVSSSFIKDTINSKHLSLLQPLVDENFGKETKIQILVDQSISKPNSEEDLEELALYTPSQPQINPTLNPKYTLESFVVGLSNNLAYAAAQAVVANPGISYNPLFIYGGTGVGKTHLMLGIGNALFKKNPSIKIIYCSSENFMNDFITSIQTKKTPEFRVKYRRCDLLLIDDIQFISGRDSTQEEFFHTFNELQTKNIQVVLTSDRPPSEIQKLEPRLASRFQGGLMVDIQDPDFDTRVAILKAKCQERVYTIPEECLTLIAENITTNARELEGRLIQIVQSLKLTGQEITLENIQKMLGQPVKGPNNKPDHKKVLNQINQYFNLKMVDLTGPRRKKELVLPRQLAMYLLYEECQLPYERVGQILGGRDHTTILHGVDKIRLVSNNDREIQRILMELKQSLY